MEVLNLPPSQTPSREVMKISVSENFSDIFPSVDRSYEHPVLGKYFPEGPMTEANPLWPLFRGVREFYEHPKPRNLGAEKETPYATAATFLQLHVVRCVDKAFSNLLQNASPPQAAVDTLDQYVVTTDQEAVNMYEARLVELRAKRDREEHEHGFSDQYSGDIGFIEFRLQRLRFEWLSATVVVHSLRQSVLEGSL